jgi:hypothetical protein
MVVRTNAYERSLEPIQVFKTIEHQMGHQGKIFVSDVDYGSVGTFISNVLIRTNRATVHLRKVISYSAGGELLVKLFENPTLSSDGTGISAICTNRHPEEITTNVAHIFSNAVASANGTLLSTHYNFGKSDSGDLQNDGVPEYILAPNSNYMVSVEHSGATGSVALSVAWYEWEH